MKRYAKFGYAAPFRFRVILEKPQGGQNDPPTRAKGKGWAPAYSPLIELEKIRHNFKGQCVLY